MRVLRIVAELDFGGVEKVLANSVPQFDNIKEIEIMVLVLGKGGRVAEELKSKGIQVLVWEKNPCIPNISLLFQLKAFFKELKPVVIHTQGAEANFHGILAGKWAGVSKIIGEEIGLPNHHSYWKYIFKYVYAKAHQVIAISEAVKDKIVSLGEVKADKVQVLYNPIQQVENLEVASYSKAQSNKKTDFVFVTTCRLVAIKNLERLIEAFSQLVLHTNDSNPRLHIIGDGPDREKLETLCYSKELTGYVNFLGFQENVLPFLKEADVFVLPSLSEGSSVSLAEAMAFGLPSIVTKVGGASEILGNSNSGFLIDPLDTQDLKNSMLKMISLSPDERKAMGQRAKEQAKSFSVDHYLESLLNVYKL
ncbi:glycosyltransferase [Arthrospiribacter ruber]|uniref:Glycosyltransferase n=1 Tax=Arthrospiribacter ruber TaxID=2487934 RepID=A0A951MBZ4_9BACT|nr:glycosyltransferase [Arthrospiribacter ruber]MBW3466600.1 glycosyltransferase [Arthrospiribacter ruber]